MDWILRFYEMCWSLEQTGNNMTIVPSDSMDTTANHNEPVYVKYEDNMFLPQYIIHYR